MKTFEQKRKNEVAKLSNELYREFKKMKAEAFFSSRKYWSVAEYQQAVSSGARDTFVLCKAIAETIVDREMPQPPPVPRFSVDLTESNAVELIDDHHWSAWSRCGE